ncbi:MAG: hypothetical protein JO251_24440 [Verrucomicrobia bacterium]|nr:hypothetical protein [Verrucomicrobiota bacterium]
MRTANLLIGGRCATYRIFFSVFAVAISVLGPLASKADPIADLRSLSVFKDADLGKMAGGDVLAAKGRGMSFARGLAVETAYVVRAPVKTTLALQSRWNPVSHPELKVYAQGDISGRGSPGEFQGLASVRSNSSVKAFVDATLKLPGDASKLQLSSPEVKLFSPGGSSEGAMPASVVTFWSKVLAGRAQSFASGGLGGQAPYDTSGSALRADQEVAQLIRESGNVRSNFSSLISSTPIGGGRGSSPTSQTWQMFDADGIAAVSLSASYGKPVGDGYQSADLLYYASGGVYAVLTFYQMWPVKVDNQDATLVWRIDMTSAAEIGGLRGVERLGSGAAMMREIQKSVKAFLRDNARS